MARAAVVNSSPAITPDRERAMPWKPRRPRRNHYLPMLVPILDAFDVLGIGITKGYELVKAGRIETVHIGRRRYATRESLERLATPGRAGNALPIDGAITIDGERP
jgi:hypothetical protein